MLPAHRDAVVDRLLLAAEQVLTTAQLRGAGLTDKDVYVLTTTGRLHRLRRGVLVDGPVWRAAAPWERHPLRARAFAASLMVPGQERLAMSHHSALALIDISTHGVDDEVHMSRVGSGKEFPRDRAARAWCGRPRAHARGRRRSRRAAGPGLSTGRGRLRGRGRSRVG